MIQKSCLLFFASLFVFGAHAQENSMFNEASYRSLTADHRAFKIGDVLTVVIQETTSATASVDSGSQKRSNGSIQVEPIQGLAGGAGVGISNDTQGGGRIQRSGRLLAQISVKVIDLSANGDLGIEGEQVVDINGEKQTIKLAGLVRQRDVDSANLVLSSRVANAQITISGDGFLADKGRPSWWDHLLGFFGF